MRQLAKYCIVDSNKDKLMGAFGVEIAESTEIGCCEQM